MDLRKVTKDSLDRNPIDEELLPLVQKCLGSDLDNQLLEEIQSKIIAILDAGKKPSKRALGIIKKKIEKNANLNGDRVTMVDDSLAMMGLFGPMLKKITDGNANFVLQIGGEGIATLCEQIKETRPKFVLVDYSLMNGITGDQLVEELNPAHVISIGFTSTPDNIVKKDFIEAGAFGVVYKDTGHPELSINRITEIIESYYSYLYAGHSSARGRDAHHCFG